MGHLQKKRVRGEESGVSRFCYMLCYKDFLYNYVITMQPLSRLNLYLHQRLHLTLFPNP